jgi:hypothetical protein
MKLVSYLKKHSRQSGKHWQLNEQLLEKIAGIKLPFTSKNYYTFCDKYLKEDVHDALFLDGDEKYFREVATDYDNLKYLYFFRQLWEREPVLCDIGCGVGNVVLYTGKMGFKSYGYEVNAKLKPLHKKLKLDIDHSDILKSDISRLKTADMVYLYRPINDTKLMNKLFALVHAHTKNDVVILYNYPHSRSIKGFKTILLGEYDDMIALVKE